MKVQSRDNENVKRDSSREKNSRVLLYEYYYLSPHVVRSLVSAIFSFSFISESFLFHLRTHLKRVD